MDSSNNKLQAVMNVDGGARGNPGPAGAGIVIASADDGTVLHESGLFLGRATNNIAEYTALVEGLKIAKTLNVARLAVYSDSELLVKQMCGVYRVKNEGLKPLFQEASKLRQDFETCTIQHVRREMNKEADRMANMAMDMKQDVSL